MGSPIAIRMEGLQKRYSTRLGAINALADVNLAVERGDIFGFLGPNGAGKSTAIRILATIQKPTSGRAEVEGHDVTEDPINVRAAVGYMPESNSVYPMMSGLQSLQYWGRLYGMKRDLARERALELLPELGLQGAVHRKVKTYSHGMRRRLLMAHALVNDPPILLLDEPAGGLDPQGIRFFRELLKKLHAQGKTVLLSSHILSEVEHTCRTVGIIHKGRMLAVDNIDALRRRMGSSLVKVEFECDSPSQQTLQAIDDLPGVSAASLTEVGLRVVASSGDIAERVTRLILDSGLRLRAVRPQEPDLEEAFLSLLEGAS